MNPKGNLQNKTQKGEELQTVGGGDSELKIEKLTGQNIYCFEMRGWDKIPLPEHTSDHQQILILSRAHVGLGSS